MLWKYKEKLKPEWTRWFAWHPTPIGRYPLKDDQPIVWLQWIERKWLDFRGSNSYEYRLCKKTTRKTLNKRDYENAFNKIDPNAEYKENISKDCSRLSKRELYDMISSIEKDLIKEYIEEVKPTGEKFLIKWLYRLIVCPFKTFFFLAAMILIPIILLLQNLFIKKR